MENKLKVDFLKETEVIKRKGIDKLLENLDYTNFVLTNFLPEEAELVENTITRAVQAVEDILNNGYQFAMQEHN